jgi:predicted nucleotidyltransferase
MEKLKYYGEAGGEVKEIVNREVRAWIFVFGGCVRGDYCIDLSDIDMAIVSGEFGSKEKKLGVF